MNSLTRKEFALLAIQVAYYAREIPHQIARNAEKGSIFIKGLASQNVRINILGTQVQAPAF